MNLRWQAEMAQFMEVTHDYSGAASDRLPLIFDPRLATLTARRVGLRRPRSPSAAGPGRQAGPAGSNDL